MKFKLAIILCLFILLCIGYPNLDEDKLEITPNGIFMTHAIAWDLGAINYSPEGYVEFYDFLSASNGIVFMHNAIDINEDSLNQQHIPNITDNIKKEFLSGLLQTNNRLISLEEGQESQTSFIQSTIDESDMLIQKYELQKLFEDSTKDIQYYIDKSEKECFIAALEEENTGLFELVNFKIVSFEYEKNDLTSMKVDLQCGNTSVVIDNNSELKLIEDKELIPTLLDFIMNNTDQIESQIIVQATNNLKEFDNRDIFQLKSIYIIPTLFAEDYEYATNNSDLILFQEMLSILNTIKVKKKKASLRNIKELKLHIYNNQQFFDSSFIQNINKLKKQIIKLKKANPLKIKKKTKKAKKTLKKLKQYLNIIITER